MGGQHKKKLRAEKAKVKLKGAKLPKGLNVTKTEFKVRKILIRDQLKDAVVIDGKRQINLKENIIRLKNHSVNMRLEGLRNIREILCATHTPNILNQLNDLIRGISALCLDIEKEVRRETHKVLSVLLNDIPLEKVRPFFHIISAYLRCAMTHVVPAIQDDSLLILDILLKYVPRLVILDSADLFNNFLQMMSRQRTEGTAHGQRAGFGAGGGAGTGISAERTLTVRMGGKQTTITWRSNVLKRLQQILNTLAEYKKQNNNIGYLTVTTPNFQLHTFNTKERQYYNLLRPYATSDYTTILNVTSNTSTAPAGTSVGATAAAAVGESFTNGFSADESLILRNYVQHLMPLLLEAWIEVRPQDVYTNEQILLSVDAATTLKIVLNIIQNLWELIKIHDASIDNNELTKWFRHEYSIAFTTNFFHFGFPYQLSDGKAENHTFTKQKRTTTAVNSSEVYCLEQNINLIALTSIFYGSTKATKTKTTNLTAAQRKIQQNQILAFTKSCAYLNVILRQPKKYQIDNYRYLLYALRQFLLHNAQEYLIIDAEQMQELLCTTIEHFLLCKNVTISTNILILLCDIINRTHLLHAFKSEHFEKFLKYLPNYLLNASVNVELLKSMQNLAKRKNCIFLDALKAQIEPIIENIQKIQINGALNAYEGKKHIMNLFYWLDNVDDNVDDVVGRSKCCWSKEKLDYLVKKIEQNVVDKRILSYFKSILLKK